MENNSKKELIPYWWRVVGIFALGWAAMYAGRTVLNPVMPLVQQEFGLSQGALGGISSMFFLAYTLLQVPSGILGDKFGRKTIMVPGFLLFAVFMALASGSTSLTIFMVFWVLVGAAQGSYYGPQFALSSEAIPKKWITVGSAIINCGMSFGISFGYFLSSYMVQEMGTSWKAPFFAVAIPIGVVALLMAFFVRERVTPLDKATQTANAAAKEDFKFFDLFKNRNLVMAYITIFCSIYGFFVIVTWLPTYLQKERGMSMLESAGLTSIVPWIAIIGCLVCSYASDKLGRRKPVVLCMMPLSLIAIWGIVASSSTTVLVIVLVLYGLIGKIALNPVLVALVSDNAPKASLSTAFSLYNFFGMGSTIFAPWATGYLADLTGSLNAGFYFAAAITVVGIIAMLFVKEGEPQAAAQPA